ncbi:MAG: FtsQ-type POTRA domain-containing protein [Firmicutes bacterium]|nr:FtsQ-type POTRA domain-containing protein [Bacillota bacterium]
MRNKRLIIIFSVLVAVTLMVLLSSVIFTVRSTTTRCLNHAFSDPALDQRIIDSMDLEKIKGKSIFFIKENELIANIEKVVPEVSVVNIERKFPDRLTVHYVKLFDYYEIAVGGFYYSLTHEGRVIDEEPRLAPKPDDQRIRIVYSGTAPEFGGYIYDGVKRQIISEIVSALERLDLAEEKAAARFDFIDIEAGKDCIYIGLAGGNNLIKIEGASDIGSLFGKIQLGYTTVIDPFFDRAKGQDGRYRMAYVLSSKSAMDPYSDYRY